MPEPAERGDLNALSDTSNSHFSKDDVVNGTTSHPRSSISHPPHSNSRSASRRSSYQPFPPLSPVTSDSASGQPQGQVMPMRLPRPLTPGEMHMELEREQEAIVNRLTREITALQTATTAAVRRASTASNTSNVAITPGGPPTPGMIPIDAADPRVARSGSSAMARSSSGAGGSREVDVKKAEMEDVKRENEMLKARVRELEAKLRRKKDEMTDE